MKQLIVLPFLFSCTLLCDPTYPDKDMEEKKAYWYMECKKAQFSEEFCRELVNTKEKMERADFEEAKHCNP